MREALSRISKGSHVVVRIDEYDRAIGSAASSGHGMHEAHKQVEAEFMNWLQNTQEENFLVKNDIFLVLTTNHKENITGPLLRSGRADLVIDIADFDEKGIKEAFVTSPTRMKNRGVELIGFNSVESFQKAVDGLDLDEISSIAMQNGFTVRDVETLLQEMAAHRYYFKKYGEGIDWNTESFLKVLEGSIGSTKDENTCELKLGDRDILSGEKEVDPQINFDFYDSCNTKFDIEQFMDVGFFEE